MILNKTTRDSLLKQAFEDRALIQHSRMTAEKQFNSAHQKLMKDFEAHAVTRELSGGPGSKNITGSLPHGNLFGFIGFESGLDPIAPIRASLLKANILIHKSSRRTFSRIYRVNIPSMEDLYKVTPMPWSSGSWLYALEKKGISNLGQYLAGDSDRSRSGAGIQTKISRGGTVKINYVSTLLEEFEENIEKSPNLLFG